MKSKKTFFSDYNNEVLEYCTAKNIKINYKQNNYSFLKGDWRYLDITDRTIDIILASQIIYRT